MDVSFMDVLDQKMSTLLINEEVGGIEGALEAGLPSDEVF